MTEKIFDWLSEKFGEEFQRRFPFLAAVAFCFLLLLLLGGEKGVYKSALLSLLNLKLAELVDKDWLISLPVYLVASAMIVIFGGYFIVKMLARKYFAYVCTLPTYKMRIEAMFSEQVLVRRGGSIVDDLREASTELNRRRVGVGRLVLGCQATALLGLALLFSGFWGNLFDTACAIVFIFLSIYLLHLAVRRFLSKVTPWHAKVSALSVIPPVDRS